MSAKAVQRMFALVIACAVTLPAFGMQRIVLSETGTEFQFAKSGERFTPWGFNYDRDNDLRLLHEYWVEEWERVTRDLEAMRELGANVVRIHLQTAAFMTGPDEIKAESIAQLVRLLDHAEEVGLYLNLTGLGSYRKYEDPVWYRDASETERWAIQARFWQAIAKACAGRPAVFCYNLMNEPVLTDGEHWVPEENLAGLHYIQRIVRDRAGRTRQEIAKAWVDTMAEAIRREDDETLITVGVIPWVFHFGGGTPLFYSEEVRENLDFASVHFYPRHGEVDKALEALAVYKVGMPLVVEETAPIHCSMEEFVDFIERSRSIADGWLGFFWGEDLEYYAEKAEPARAEPYEDWEYEDWVAYHEEEGDDMDEELREAVIAFLKHRWLEFFRDAAPRMTNGSQ